MVLASLWYGNKKPSMGTFLKPFLKSLQKMNEGIQCTSPERGQFLCRGLLLCGTADLPARSLLCNHVQYNGAFSCWKCEQEGETASVGRGHARIFPFQGEEPKGPVRTKENVLENARTAVQDQQVVMGKPVKGAMSPVSPMSCARSDVSARIDPALFHSPGSSHLGMKFQALGRGRATSPNQNGAVFQGSGPPDFYENHQHPGYVGEPNAGMRIVSDGEYRHVQQGMGRDNMRGSQRGYRGRGNIGYNIGRGNYNRYQDNFFMYGNRGRGMAPFRGRGVSYNRGGPWGYTDNPQGNYQGGYRNQDHYYQWQNGGPAYNSRGFRGGRARPNRGRGGQFTSMSKPEKRIMDRPCAKCRTIGGFQCSRCKTPYCSHQCQVDHWPEHSQNCRAIKDQLEEDDLASQFEVTIGEDAVAEEMKSFAKSIVQEQYGFPSGTAKSPQSSQQMTPNRPNRPSPKQSSSSSTLREPKQRSSVSPAQNTSTPSPKVPPQGEHQNLAPAPSNKIVMNTLEVGEEYELIVSVVEDPSRIGVQLLDKVNLQKLPNVDAEMKKLKPGTRPTKFDRTMQLKLS